LDKAREEEEAKRTITDAADLDFSAHEAKLSNTLYRIGGPDKKKR